MRVMKRDTRSLVYGSCGSGKVWGSGFRAEGLGIMGGGS